MGAPLADPRGKNALLKVIQVVQEFQMGLHFLVQLVEVVEQLPLDLTLQMELGEMEVQEHQTQF